jgi:hypothetical protein
MKKIKLILTILCLISGIVAEAQDVKLKGSKAFLDDRLVFTLDEEEDNIKVNLSSGEPLLTATFTGADKKITEGFWAVTFNANKAQKARLKDRMFFKRFLVNELVSSGVESGGKANIKGIESFVEKHPMPNQEGPTKFQKAMGLGGNGNVKMFNTDKEGLVKRERIGSVTLVLDSLVQNRKKIGTFSRARSNISKSTVMETIKIFTVYGDEVAECISYSNNESRCEIKLKKDDRTIIIVVEDVLHKVEAVVEKLAGMGII